MRFFVLALCLASRAEATSSCDSYYGSDQASLSYSCNFGTPRSESKRVDDEQRKLEYLMRVVENRLSAAKSEGAVEAGYKAHFLKHYHSQANSRLGIGSFVLNGFHWDDLRKAAVAGPQLAKALSSAPEEEFRDEFDPVFSPGGGLLALQSWSKKGPGLALWDLGSGKKHYPLWSREHISDAPVFSPGGGKFALVRGGMVEEWVHDPSGPPRKNSGIGGGARYCVAKAPEYLAGGSRLLFSLYDDLEDGAYWLNCASDSARGCRRISGEVRGWSAYDFAGRVSPDGKAFLVMPGEAEAGKIIDPDGDSIALLPDPELENVSFRQAVWSPDSRHFAAFGIRALELDRVPVVAWGERETGALKFAYSGRDFDPLGWSEDGKAFYAGRITTADKLRVLRLEEYKAEEIKGGQFWRVLKASPKSGWRASCEGEEYEPGSASTAVLMIDAATNAWAAGLLPLAGERRLIIRDKDGVHWMLADGEADKKSLEKALEHPEFVSAVFSPKGRKAALTLSKNRGLRRVEVLGW